MPRAVTSPTLNTSHTHTQKKFRKTFFESKPIAPKHKRTKRGTWDDDNRFFCTCQKGSEETLAHDYFAAGYEMCARRHRASIARQSVIIRRHPRNFRRKTTTLASRAYYGPVFAAPLNTIWVEPGFTAKSYAIALIFRHECHSVKGWSHQKRAASYVPEFLVAPRWRRLRR